MKRLPKVMIAHLGARMHYAVPKIFEEAGMMERLYTDIYIGNKPLLKLLINYIPLRIKLFEKLKGRNDSIIPPGKVMSFDLFGLKYWWKQRNAKGNELWKVFAEGGKEFCKAIMESGIPDIDIVYGFNSASLELFEFSKSKGIKCILEQTIAPQKVQRQLLLEEKEKWTGWQDDIEFSEIDDPLSEREEEEWRLADLIICGSEFVKKNLIKFGVPDNKIKVVPYGVDLNKFKPVKKEPLKDRALRVLFIGNVELRKGIPYLLEALRMLNTKYIDVKIVGKVSISKDIIKRYNNYVEFVGPLPRTRINELYKWADVFVLPSICEGSATVTYEALASGIPVIATPNTGSPVKDEIDGHIVPIRNSEAIALILDKYIKDPELLKSEQISAINGRERVGFEAYKNRLIRTITSIGVN